jgi:hypothetical protein
MTDGPPKPREVSVPMNPPGFPWLVMLLSLGKVHSVSSRLVCPRTDTWMYFSSADPFSNSC